MRWLKKRKRPPLKNNRRIDWPTCGHHTRCFSAIIGVVLGSFVWPLNVPTLLADDAEILERSLVDTVQKIDSSLVSMFIDSVPSSTPTPANPFDPLGDFETNGELDFSKTEESEQPQPTDPDYIPAQSTFGIGIRNPFRNNEIMFLGRMSELLPTQNTGSIPDKFSGLKVYVRFNDSDNDSDNGIVTQSARIYSADPRSDLILVQLTPSDFPTKSLRQPLAIGNAERLNRGSLVIRISNSELLSSGKSPIVQHIMVTHPLSDLSAFATKNAGVLNGDSNRKTLAAFGRFLWTPSSKFPVHSDGVLVDRQGTLVGFDLHTPFAIRSEFGVTRSFPINTNGRRIITTLLKGEEVEYGFLGVIPIAVSSEESSELTNDEHQRPAVKIGGIVAGSPADKGALAVDDLIIAINDMPIRSLLDFQREVYLSPPGQIAKLKIWKKNRKRTRDVSIEMWKSPIFASQHVVAPNSLREHWRGLNYDYSTSKPNEGPEANRPIQECLQGVLIVGIDKNSQAEETRLRIGNYITHVNGQPVPSPKEFEQVTARLKGAATLNIIGGDRIRIGE